MAAPFAALETRLNEAAMKHIANKTGTLNGVSVSGVFDNDYLALEFGGSASSPSFTLLSSAVPASVVGMAMVIGSTTYKVAETLPDGTGVTTLRLRV